MNAVSDRLFSAATACITASAGKSSSGITAAGLPRKRWEVNASMWKRRTRISVPRCWCANPDSSLQCVHRGLDPLLDLTVDLADVAISWSDGLADHQANGPGLLEQPSSRPITARVVRHRNDEPAGLCREQGSTDTVAAGLSRRH